MKKVLFILIMFAFTTNIFAQNTSDFTAQKTDSLQIQLNKLQHDYDFLYYNSELSKLKLELKIQRNEILASSALIYSVYILSGEYDKEIYFGLKESFETHNTYLNVYEQFITEYQKLLPLISTFSEEEKNTLERNLKVIEECFQNVKGALEHQEFLIDKYKELKWK